MKAMFRHQSLASFQIRDHHGEMRLEEEVLAGSKTIVVVWKNLRGHRAACQWIGFQSEDFNQKTLKFDAWINFVGSIPNKRGNFGLKVCGTFYNSFLEKVVPDTWYHISEEVKCHGGDGNHIILIFDHLSKQGRVIKMHSVTLKDPSLDGKKLIDASFAFPLFFRHLNHKIFGIFFKILKLLS